MLGVRVFGLRRRVQRLRLGRQPRVVLGDEQLPQEGLGEVVLIRRRIGSCGVSAGVACARGASRAARALADALDASGAALDGGALDALPPRLAGVVAAALRAEAEAMMAAAPVTSATAEVC